MYPVSPARNEIYVVPYPGPGAKRQITSTGGVSPMWRGDGRELYLPDRRGDDGDGRDAGTPDPVRPPRLLFGGDFFIDGSEDGPRAYDATADGKRFLMIQLTPVGRTAADAGGAVELETLMARIKRISQTRNTRITQLAES